eukprot:PhF_6_TR17063/c0_g1_i3/m.26114
MGPVHGVWKSGKRKRFVLGDVEFEFADIAQASRLRRVSLNTTTPRDGGRRSCCKRESGIISHSMGTTIIDTTTTTIVEHRTPYQPSVPNKIYPYLHPREFIVGSRSRGPFRSVR